MTNLNAKWDELEKDVQDAIQPIIQKHQDRFGNDSYAVIGAIDEIINGMFQRL